MSTDIRLNEDFMRNYKTRTLRKRLGAEAILSLQSLWLWAAVNRSEGILYKMNPTKIEGVAEWDGKEGDFFTALVDLEWLDRLEDGTYALHQWVEHQAWAADSANRSDKARLLNMAKNYPELYEELTAQGYTGIDSASYAEITAEYNRRGILRHSSNFLRTANVPATPKPNPTPEPDFIPLLNLSPSSSPSEDITIHKTVTKNPTSLSSSSSEENKTGIIAQKQQAKSAAQADSATKAEAKDPIIKPEKILVQDEEQHSLQETVPVKNPKTLEAAQAKSTTSAEQKPSAEQYVSKDAVEATIADVLKQWNLQLARLGFPKALRTTKRRESAFKARIHCSQERIYLTWWVALFDKIAASNFMCESARQKANWLTLDWVLNEQNMIKILEGKYDSERPVTAEIHRKPFRARRVEEAAQPTKAVQDAPVQDTPAHGIPEDTLQRINDMRKLLGKQPISNDTCTARSPKAVMGTEIVEAKPQETEREVPTEKNTSVEDTGYTAEELADYYAILDEYRAEQATKKTEFEASFSLKESLEEISDDDLSEKEYGASMKGSDDDYVA